MELKTFFAQDNEGNVLPGATCTVYERGTENLAMGLVSATGGQLSNPFTASSPTGQVLFAAPNGLYDIRVQTATRDYRIPMQFNDVGESVASANNSATRAEQARDAAQLTSGIVDTIAAGLAATANTVNKYFSVTGNDTADFLILYKNTAGVAVEVRRYPSPDAITAIGKRTHTSESIRPQYVPFAVTDSGQVPAWFRDGMFDVNATTPEFNAKVVEGRMAEFPENAVTRAMTPVYFTPYNVLMWFENGKLGVPGLSDDLMSQIGAFIQAAPPVSAKKSPAPIATDASTLFKWRAKLADIRYGVSGAKAKVGMTGDSWVEISRIPNAMRTLLESVIPNGGEGFQSLNLGNHLNGVATAYTGFTLIDGGQVDIGTTPVGPDGMSLTTTAANATFSMTGCRFTDLNIYYHDNGAAFRYRIDGGAWVPVAGTSTTVMAYVTVAGLTDAIHNLEIDSTGNAATLYLLGLYPTRSVGGVEVSRMGNAGAYSTYIDKWVGGIQPFAATMNLDLLFVILGTNDQRYVTSPPSKYIEVLQKLVNGYRAATPDIGIVLIIPAITAPTTIVNPLYLYRDALYKFCIENKCEFFNMHDFFGTYEQSNALGQFADTLHPNERGALNLVHELNNKFLKIK